MDRKRRGVPSRVIGLSNLKDVWKKGVKHGSLSRVTIGECLVPHVEPSFFWFTDIEVTQNNANSIGRHHQLLLRRLQRGRCSVPSDDS